MSKYKKEFKLKVVKYILEENYCISQATKKFEVSKNQVEIWVRKYQEHGIKGLFKNIKKYDGNFKNYVIEYMHTNHLSLNETAIKFNIANHVIVGKWERIYYEEGPHALFEERRGRSKNMNVKLNKKIAIKKNDDDLIDEIQRLRIENAYLKKLNALVQERVQRENPKKQKS